MIAGTVIIIYDTLLHSHRHAHTHVITHTHSIDELELYLKHEMV